jgi:hypothetical protein
MLGFHNTVGDRNVRVINYRCFDSITDTGCVYLHPSEEKEFDADVKSWVIASRKKHHRQAR